MAGRPSKPVQLIKLEGNKDKRTKAELEYREKMEQSLYTGTNFKESPAVKSDPVAHKEFLRLKKLYKHIQFVDGLDEQIINRYCLMVSEEKSLLDLLGKIQEDIDAIDDPTERAELYKTYANLMNKLNKTRDMLLKIEDRLFLNPTARVKAIPKKPPEEEKESPMANFLKRRAGGNHAT